jgi:type VI protein secretion system component VasF
MIDKQSGPLKVRPNTLRDQSAPNTFRSQAGPGPVGRQDLNSGGGNAAPPRRASRPQLPLWVYVALAVLVVVVALYLLNRMP